LSSTGGSAVGSVWREGGSGVCVEREGGSGVCVERARAADTFRGCHVQTSFERDPK
jgi:hypothetical protein